MASCNNFFGEKKKKHTKSQGKTLAPIFLCSRVVKILTITIFEKPNAKNFFPIPIKCYIFYHIEHYRNMYITKHAFYIKSQEAFFSPAG